MSSDPATAIRRTISIVAAVALDREGKTLLVRKRGTQAFMQPGGKLAPDEAGPAALAREIKEELGCRIATGSCHALGRFAAPAANEPDCMVDAELFAVTLEGAVVAAAEIEEAIWVDPDKAPAVPLAPLTEHHALPLARKLKAAQENAP